MKAQRKIAHEGKYTMAGGTSCGVSMVTFHLGVDLRLVSGKACGSDGPLGVIAPLSLEPSDSVESGRSVLEPLASITKHVLSSWNALMPPAILPTCDRYCQQLVFMPVQSRPQVQDCCLPTSGQTKSLVQGYLPYPPSSRTRLDSSQPGVTIQKSTERFRC